MRDGDGMGRGTNLDPIGRARCVGGLRERRINGLTVTNGWNVPPDLDNDHKTHVGKEVKRSLKGKK